MTTFIKVQKQNAVGLTRGRHPEAGLTSFCASMEDLLSGSGLPMDYIHFSAIITAAAHIWTGAQQSPTFRGHADVHERLQALFKRCIHSLHAVTAHMKARAISNVLWSSATLSFNPDDAVPGMVHALTSKFVHLLEVAEEKHRPNAHDVANLVWALGVLKHTPLDDRLLKHCCTHMHTLLRSQDERNHPIAQGVANMLWALAQLKHAPSHDVVTAMLDRLVALRYTPGLQLNSQNISNSFLACAGLGLGVKPTCTQALLKHFLELHISAVNYQHCCNLAWSLAVLQCLDFNTFKVLLDKLTTTRTMLVRGSGPQSISAQLTTAGATQLHQALAWLRPPSGSRQMKAWSSLQSRLQTVAPQPAARKVSVPGQNLLRAAPAMQGVPYQAQVQLGVYQANALLSPHDSDCAEVILMVERDRDFIKNVRNR